MQMEPPVIQYTPIIEWSMSDFIEFLLLGKPSQPCSRQLTDDNEMER